MPTQTQERYIKQKTVSPYVSWRFTNNYKIIPLHKILRIEVMDEACVRWTDDEWETTNEIPAKDTGIGIFLADIDSKNKESDNVEFTFFWPKFNKWENKNFRIKKEKSI